MDALSADDAVTAAAWYRLVPRGDPGGRRAGYAAGSVRVRKRAGCGASEPVGRPYSTGPVRVGFEDADFFDQRVELSCVVGDDGGRAHGVVVGAQAGKLVVVGDEPRPAVEAMIVVGVTGVEKHPLVPDDVLQEFAVGERGPADIVGGEACQVEPVPREPFWMVPEPAPVALDLDHVAFSQKVRAGERTVTVAAG